MCLIDLAKGFEARNKDKLSTEEIDKFMQNCVNLALQTAPDLITAKLLQVELDKRNFVRTHNKLIYKQLETNITKLFADGYLELPELMYSEQPRTAGLDSTYAPFYEENQREGNPAGYGKKVLTLSNGRYDEFLTTKKIETVGSVRFDTERKKIVGFGENKREVEVVSRFLSVDPLAQSYPFYSPYHFAGNMPIQAIDLDGLEEKKTTGTSSMEKEMAHKLQSEYWYYKNQGEDLEAAKVGRKIAIEIVKAARVRGYTNAADNLQHYINGSGKEKVLDSKLLTSNQHVNKAVETNLQRFKEDNKSNYEKLYEELEEGESTNFTDYWETLVTLDREESMGDLFYSLGNFTIKSTANFKVTKKDGQLLISGNVTHKLIDKYDWDRDVSADLEGYTIDDKSMNELKTVGAKDFPVTSTWQTSVKKNSSIKYNSGYLNDTVDTTNLQF